MQRPPYRGKPCETGSLRGFGPRASKNPLSSAIFRTDFQFLAALADVFLLAFGPHSAIIVHAAEHKATWAVSVMPIRVADARLTEGEKC